MIIIPTSGLQQNKIGIENITGYINIFLVRSFILLIFLESGKMMKPINFFLKLFSLSGILSSSGEVRNDLLHISC